MNKTQETIAKFRAGAKLPVTAMRSGSSASAHLLDGNSNEMGWAPSSITQFKGCRPIRQQASADPQPSVQEVVRPSSYTDEVKIPGKRYVELDRIFTQPNGGLFIAHKVHYDGDFFCFKCKKNFKTKKGKIGFYTWSHTLSEPLCKSCAESLGLTVEGQTD